MNKCEECICTKCELNKECPMCFNSKSTTIERIEDCVISEDCLCFSDWIRDITDNLSIERKKQILRGIRGRYRFYKNPPECIAMG